ncbi:type II toxin-antitoxin system HicA family toxin [Agrococcus casei]|uniref:YcfA family protein n=1 Tax=Agrococcus casei LMG 22410 TaxID=1255656 RepID=A0A1R4FYP5_9MICO|nr:type II toxin-antitoxin system HicA family toxin [Agrococcus casei]SJM61035.1 hypothetical protein CZ674_07465 [Agrococcus casei LMG 22410]
MKHTKRKEVEQFLTKEGFASKGTRGPHEKFRHEDGRVLALPRHRVISPGVLRDIEKVVGHVPASWK